MPAPALNIKLRSRKAPELVGLDIQPGFATAVQARANGTIQVSRAAGISLPGDAMREGEVLDEGTLAEALHELFAKAHLDKRVRVGVANQRTVLRMLEMPPLTDRKELAAAVRFQAEDQVPMPLENAVLDFHALGIVDTPGGPRQRVAVVAAQRDMIQRLLSAVRRAGLRPEAIDLSAFALIRALHRPFEVPSESEQAVGDGDARVLYLNVGGLTNMAIAEGIVCRFTRVVGGGLESMAAAVAERHHLPLDRARELLVTVDLSAAPPAPLPATTPAEVAPELQPTDALEPAVDPEFQPVDPEFQPTEALPPAEPDFQPEPTLVYGQESDGPDARPVLEAGIREIANEVRNSLDFHRSQDGGGEVSQIVLSGPALTIAGFSEALSGELGIEVRRQTVGPVMGAIGDAISPEHLAVAAGLAIEEAPGR